MTATRARTTQPHTKNDNRAPCPRHALQTNRDRLARRLEQLEAGLDVEPDPIRDDFDPLIQEHTKNVALAQQFEKQLKTIDQALEAADRGEYGICKRCGQPIPPERLRVLPEARLCVRCKSKEEKSARRNMFS